ncbi:MAG TPA: cation-translocating P-type ATPase [Chitinophagaceae bacterium]|jgi:Cu+-exporting ATPase|nr:cation-translocating P-type ATPase [Chitinophagaceae bacterium]
MEKVQWKVEGMTCSNCALTIHKFLEKQGLKDVKVNAIGGDVSFEMTDARTKEELAKGIKDLGYRVAGAGELTRNKRRILSTPIERFWFCFPFTALLMLHMIPGVNMHWLMNPWIQLGLSLPVYIVGMSFFGVSAVKSLRNGMPNMDVLIALGATAAFVYSLYGTLTGQAERYMFYETAAAILTLVFLGNYLEDASIHSTQRALNSLARSQKVMANMIAYDDDHHEHIFPVENTQLKVGDLILIKSGEQVPMDCKILWGDVHVNEAIVTGESLPVHKYAKDKLIGGSVVQDGTVKAQVTAVGNDTVLSGIINLVKQAQGDKPPVQQLADKISAIFVPVVVGIAVVTLAVNWIIIKDFAPALMRGIAVLVIACPCAMGLATPAAIAVGLGRGAKTGILFRNATSLELFKDIKQVVFDKTGTLTTGQFVIADFAMNSSVASGQSPIVSRETSVVSKQSPSTTHHSPPDSYRDTIHDSRFTSHEEFKRLVYSLEKYSNHPIAKAVTYEWKTKDETRWSKIEELKGLGMKAMDNNGNEYWAGSYKLAEKFTEDDKHSIYVMKNGHLLGWVDVKDKIRLEARQVVNYLHSKNIKTILLSGDRRAKCEELANVLGIDEVIAEQTPEQKLKMIGELNAVAPTAMVGDGINDAPALAKASVGVSMSEASQIAMQTAQVVLMGSGLKNLPTALGLGKHTYLTIKQNLFWAFFYNIIAIPVAAFGFLTPTFGALVMGLSDVVLGVNSVRLFVKKVV